MYRIFLTKGTLGGLKKRCCTGPSRLFKSVRHYSEKGKICPPPHKKPTSGAIYTVGFVTIVGGGTIGYAKYDPKFREWLDENVPYSDGFIKFLFQEERSYLDSFIALLDVIKESALGILFGASLGKKKDLPEKPKDYTPPSPAFSTLAKETKDPENYSEIRLEKKEKGQDPTVIIGGEVKQKEVYMETQPKSIVELETRIGESASATVQAYNKAVYALKNYNHDVQVIIEDSIERIDPNIWNLLRGKTKAKDEALQNAEKNAKETEKDMVKLTDILSQPELTDAPSTIKQQAELNMKKVRDDITNAKKELEEVLNESNLTEKYWKKVENARNHFIDEIEILFPGVDISDKKLDLQGGELDLFILHAFANVLYYQKELYKLQILEDQKIKVALENARRGSSDILSDAQITQLVEKEKRNLSGEFQKKCLCLRLESERELRRQLKLQSETFSDHLNDALKVREKELQRDFARHLDEKVTEEKCKFQLQLSALTGRVRGMDQAFKARAESGTIVRQSQVLWSACQSLYRALRAGCPGLPWTEQLRPLAPEIEAVKNAAADNDELVKTVISAIPKIAMERGVYPEDALRERFLKVEKVARQLALVPEGGGRLPLHVLSLFHSLLLLKAASPIPQAELDEDGDFGNFSTNDILQRARYWIDRGDFAQTLRYMNLLDGASRCAAKQWMDETRVLLETQQAANILMAHAAATGLLYL